MKIYFVGAIITFASLVMVLFNPTKETVIGASVLLYGTPLLLLGMDWLIYRNRDKRKYS